MGMGVRSCSVSFIGSLGKIVAVVLLCCLLTVPRNRPSIFVAAESAAPAPETSLQPTLAPSIGAPTAKSHLKCWYRHRQQPQNLHLHLASLYYIIQIFWKAGLWGRGSTPSSLLSIDIHWNLVKLQKQQQVPYLSERATFDDIAFSSNVPAYHKSSNVYQEALGALGSVRRREFNRVHLRGHRLSQVTWLSHYGWKGLHRNYF